MIVTPHPLASSTPSIRIREALANDAERLALVGAATFLETFADVLDGEAILAHCARQHGPELYRRWLGNGSTRLWLAEARPGQAPVGYVATGTPDLPAPNPKPSDIEIKRIYLLGRFQGQGHGRSLLEAALDSARATGCRRALLGVYAGNATARAFYQRTGFTLVGERQFQVGDRLYDDVVLARPL